ncbi:MAG: hypothetical protein HPY75_10225 [Actinobacteria bacterium]|nr:hypothetical protein [Actinomycetota bacterium]
MEGMRSYFKTALWSVDIALDQMQKSWAMALEQNGKMRSELDALFTAWMSNVKSGREEFQRDLEKALTILEENAENTKGLLPPFAWASAPWGEAQAELLRAWMSLWGIFPYFTGGQGKQGEKPTKPVAKSD